MKHRPLVASLFVTALVVAGCGETPPVPSGWMPSPPPAFVSMKECDGLPCMAEAAKTCAPAAATIRTDMISVMGKPLALEYRLGIQGPSDKGCMLYDKILSVDGKGTSETRSYNYETCVFYDSAWLSDYLSKDAFLNDMQLMDWPPADQGTCDWSVPALDADNSSREYTLVPGEWIADIDASFALGMTALDFEKSATVEIRKDGKSEFVTLVPDEKQSVLGYSLVLGEFGQKNMAWMTGGDDFRNAAWITVSR